MIKRAADWLSGTKYLNLWHWLTGLLCMVLAWYGDVLYLFIRICVTSLIEFLNATLFHFLL